MAICMQERGRVFVHLAASSGLALVICDPSGGEQLVCACNLKSHAYSVCCLCTVVELHLFGVAAMLQAGKIHSGVVFL